MFKKAKTVQEILKRSTAELEQVRNANLAEAEKQNILIAKAESKRDSADEQATMATTAMENFKALFGIE